MASMNKNTRSQLAALSARQQTKQSQANEATSTPVQEDYLNTNTCWDDVDRIAAECTALLRSHAGHSVGLRQPEYLAQIDYKMTLARNVELLAKDLTQLNNELTDIKALHSGKTGGGRSFEEISSSIQVHEQYVHLLDRHETIVMPTSSHISEQFIEAERKLIEQGKTDVVEHYGAQLNAFNRVVVASSTLGALKEQQAEQEAAQAQDPNVITDVTPREV